MSSEGRQWLPHSRLKELPGISFMMSEGMQSRWVMGTGEAVSEEGGGEGGGGEGERERERERVELTHSISKKFVCTPAYLDEVMWQATELSRGVEIQQTWQRS